MCNSSNTYYWLSAITDTVRYAVVVAVLVMLLSGCAANQQKQESQGLERLLISAGFQMKLADTPEKLEHLKTLPQRKFFRHQRNGKVSYLYADADPCKCIYTGDKEAYQRFLELAREEKLEERQDRRDQMLRPERDATSWVEDATQGRLEPWW